MLILGFFFQGSGEELFDHIASCLADFVFDRELLDEILPLGFTFSFPCEQEGLAKARLVKWTKGFNCAGVEGEDVVQCLRDAIKRRGDVNIEVCAILNGKWTKWLDFKSNCKNFYRRHYGLFDELCLAG